VSNLDEKKGGKKKVVAKKWMSLYK
jgi:hypothetical protein